MSDASILFLVLSVVAILLALTVRKTGGKGYIAEYVCWCYALFFSFMIIVT